MKDLSSQAKLYIVMGLAGGGLLTIWQLTHLDVQRVELLVLACAVASVFQVMKTEGAAPTSSFGLSWVVYGAAFPVLGVSETLIVIIVAHIFEWIWHRSPWYIQSFNIASFAIAASVAALLYEMGLTTAWPSDLLGIILIFSANLAFTLVNHLLMGTLAKLVHSPSLSASDVLSYAAITTDLGLLCLGTSIALISTIGPLSVVFLVIVVYLLQNVLQVPALKRQSELEPKTGLYNTAYFDSVLKKEWEQPNKLNHPLTVVMADLDLLRDINNAYGHLAGDEVIRKVAQFLQVSARESDTVARFGGEEFVVLMPDTTPAQALEHVEAMRTGIEAAEFAIQTSPTPVKITISFGIAGRDTSNQRPQDLIHNADVAAYAAKRAGRNCTRVHGEESLCTVLPRQIGPAVAVRTNGHEILDRFEVQNGASHLSAQIQGQNHRSKPVIGPPSTSEESKKSNSSAARSHSIRIYIAGVALAALTLVGLLLRPNPDLDWVGVLIFVLVAGAAEALATDMYGKDTSVSTSVAPLVAATLAFGPIGAVATSFAITLVHHIRHRTALNRLVFNTSNHLIASLLCTAIILLTGKPFWEWAPGTQFILTLLSALIIYLTTTLLIAGAVGLSSGEPAKTVWRNKFQWLAPHYVALGFVAYALIFGFAVMGIIGIVVLLVPLLMLHFSQKQYITATGEIVDQLQETNDKLREQSAAVRKLNDELFLALAGTIDLRDPDVMEHSIHVARYAAITAKELGLPPERIELIRRAGLMHDIGKLAIPEVILFKPARLTTEEHDIVKEHVTIGADLLSEFQTLRNITTFVRYHHERYDGYGYPDGLRGEQIPLEARILALADAVEAMASDRTYRKGMGVTDILEEIIRHSGTQFDPAAVRAFSRVIKKQGNSIIVNSARNMDHETEEHLRMQLNEILPVSEESQRSGALPYQNSPAIPPLVRAERAAP